MKKWLIVLLLLSVSVYSFANILEDLIYQFGLDPNTMGTVGGNGRFGYSFTDNFYFYIDGNTNNIYQKDQRFNRFALQLQGDINKDIKQTYGLVAYELNLGKFSVGPFGRFDLIDTKSDTKARILDDSFPDSLLWFTEMNESERLYGPAGGITLGYTTDTLSATVRGSYSPWVQSRLTRTLYDTVPVWFVGSNLPEYAWAKNVYSIETTGIKYNIDAKFNLKVFKNKLRIAGFADYAHFNYAGTSEVDSWTWRGSKDTPTDDVTLIDFNQVEEHSYSIIQDEIDIGVSFMLLFFKQLFPRLDNVPGADVSWVKTIRDVTTTLERIVSDSGTSPFTSAGETSKWLENYSYFKFSIKWAL
jgi:hypothetical protein